MTPSRSSSGPALICVGGVDPSGGAGLIRDAWAIDRVGPGLDRAFVVSAWTWQGRGVPARARGRSAGEVLGDLERALARFDVARSWVKFGLLPDALVAPTVEWLAGQKLGGVVLDPVLRASDGGDMGARASSLRVLAERCTLTTPNRDESEALGWSPDEAVGLPHAVLFKGWGTNETRVQDRLVHAGAAVDFARARVEGPDPRGTGCALASAIAAYCAKGSSLEAACGQGIAWLDARRVHTRPGPDGRAHLL